MNAGGFLLSVQAEFPLIHGIVLEIFREKHQCGLDQLRIEMAAGAQADFFACRGKRGAPMIRPVV